MAIRLSYDHDLVEEFIATGLWLLCGNTWKEFSMEIVYLPHYSPGHSVPFPWFRVAKAEGETDEAIVQWTEGSAVEILGDYSDKEHALRIAILGRALWLNFVFEELRVKYTVRR